MKVIEFSLTATSRVSVGNGPAVVNHREISRVIPGSTLRGALASGYARDAGMSWSSPSPDFVDTFERFGRFGVGVPAGHMIARVSHVRCKYPSPACSREWHDCAGDVLAGQQTPRSCPVCGGTWEFGKGQIEPAPTTYAAGQPPRGPAIVSTTRTALSPDGVAMQGQLFTRRAVTAGAVFHGRILFSEGPAEDVAAWLLTDHTLRVGGQRSVLGSMRWHAAESTDDVPPSPALAAITCISPMVLLDQYGATTLDLDDVVERELGAKVIARWVRPVRVSGWHAASALPKPAEWAIAPGSTFMLAGLAPEAGSRLLLGLGWRTSEGYGQVDLYDASVRPAANRVTSSVTAPAHEARPTPSGTSRPGPPKEAAEPPEPSMVELAASALRAAVQQLPTEKLRDQIGRRVDESIGQIAKLRRTGGDAEADRVIRQRLDEPIVRQHLDEPAIEAWRWALTEATAEEMKRLRSALQGGGR